ncbi:L-rhamnose mutarotase [Aridibaculum aurantiacum]|uniref:L-rhamnose mutarotase n=1 Tax=Aridibaculum aurantiacum TaxID=2810307 RepID=UPI001A95A0F8|nr:L-rhamnose mutarotase [Aridibaculum aurantiacum]
MNSIKQLVVLLIFCCTFHGAFAVDIWVSVKGSDHNDGTKEKPLATVAIALRKARELRRLNDPSVTTGIRIVVGEGVYKLEEPIIVRPEDSGTPTSPTIIEAAAGATPVLSGGVLINGWRKAPGWIAGLPKAAQGKVWVADAPMVGGRLLEFRQLWVNDAKAVRAKQTPGSSMNRILSWNHKDQTCWIPKPSADVSNAEGLEMLIHQWWAIANLRVKEIQVQGDSAKLTFHQPESRIQSEHPWPAPWISKKTGNSAFYLINAIQFLDEPGEWFLDMKNRKLYYYPKAGENMLTASVVAPALETLVRIEGTIDHPVSYVFFKGLSFQHATWLRPSKEGHVPHQAGMPMTDAYKLKVPGTPDKKGLENQAWLVRPAAAVEAAFTNNTGFEACRFEHLASTGLDYKRGNHHDVIKGNLFKDIGGNGILAGVFSDEAYETHRPYDPADEREITTNTHIVNNLITDVTNEDWGCIGIAAGYVRGINIEHNEISNVSYSGISMGWGWTRTINAMRNNRIHANKIHHYGKHMYDVSAIYTLSAQPGSVISNNYVDSIYVAPYAHDPHHWFYLYTDEGSSYFTVKDNWTPAEKFLQNANGPGNAWTNNGPQVADSIKLLAGIQTPYQYLVKERTVDNSWPINKYIPVSKDKQANKHAAINKPVVIEVVAPAKANEAAIKNVFSKNGVSSNDIYHWNNHLVAFTPPSDTINIRKQIATVLPQSRVNIYNDMFYVFDRNACNGKGEVKEWDHILLTANLVKDPKLQQEYLDYHAKQQQLFPEVAKGFCNADFQQLLLFKNGRQLMLIISIPKGASLDELNPKTMENNPRVNEWNSLMSKFQEGIEGTKKGETWVFLEKYK